MPNQNLISASLPETVKTEIIQNLKQIKSQLEFLLALQPDDIKGIFKSGNGYYPFIDKAYSTVNNHPDILPSSFNTAEFLKDYTLSKDLTAIADLINELAEGLQKTLTAVNSDALASALDIYAAVKLYKDKVSGLKVVADEMSEFFQRSGKKALPPTSQTNIQ